MTQEWFSQGKIFPKHDAREDRRGPLKREGEISPTARRRAKVDSHSG